jgi:glutathione S-transferase
MSTTAVQKPILFGTLLSQPVRAVFWFCKLNQIDIEFKNVNLLEGEHQTESFLKMNPVATVPTLQDGEYYLFESQTIVRYLAEKYNASKMWFPKDVGAKYHVNSYLDWHHTNTRPSIAGYTLGFYLNSIFDPDFQPPSPEAGKKMKDKLEKLLEQVSDIWLNWKSGKGHFICGQEEPSLADIFFFEELIDLKLMPKLEYESILERFPKLKDYAKLMEKLPHFETVHSELDEFRLEYHK